MRELESIRKELDGNLALLETAHEEQELINTELSMMRSRETQNKNIIVKLSKSIRAIQKELEEDYLEE